MGFSDKIKKAFFVNDSDYYDPEEDVEQIDEDEDEFDSMSRRTSAPQRERGFGRNDRAERKSNQGAATKVVDIHTTAKLQVVLKKPEHFDEGKAIADELIEKRTVVINLEATAKDEAGKLLCFLSGVAYANGGKLKKIANNTYIITPYNVDVMGDLLDELENNGMFFV